MREAIPHAPIPQPLWFEATSHQIPSHSPIVVDSMMQVPFPSTGSYSIMFSLKYEYMIEQLFSTVTLTAKTVRLNKFLCLSGNP